MERACLRPPGLSSQVHTGHIPSALFSGAGAVCVHTDAAVKHHHLLQPPRSPNLFDPKGRRSQLAHCALWLLPGFTAAAEKLPDGCQNKARKTKIQQTFLAWLQKGEESYTLKAAAVFFLKRVKVSERSTVASQNLSDKQQQQLWSSSHQHSSFLYCDFSLPGMQGLGDPICELWNIRTLELLCLANLC